MTIGEQSVSAMMPSLIAGVSGASLAYTPPAHPCGTPANSAAAELVPATLRNARLVDCFISLLRQEDVGDHRERPAVGGAGRRLFEERSGEQMGVARRQRQLRKQRPRHL